MFYEMTNSPDSLLIYWNTETEISSKMVVFHMMSRELTHRQALMSIHHNRQSEAWWKDSFAIWCLEKWLIRKFQCECTKALKQNVDEKYSC